eukprot:Polyplicarium_translucidae@DN3389_c0_g5_i1.p1
MSKWRAAALGVGGAVSVIAALAAYSTSKKSQSAEKKEAPKEEEIEWRPEESANVSIYFGSQTATAEGFSKDFSNVLSRERIDNCVIDLEDFDPAAMSKQKVMVFIVATYGDGEPTDNALRFRDWLVNEPDEAAAVLRGKAVAIMGLGNRQYPQFNEFAYFLEKRFRSFGADLIGSVGVGDDDQDIEKDFRIWAQDVLPLLLPELAGDEEPSESSVSARGLRTSRTMGRTFSFSPSLSGSQHSTGA